MAKLSIRPYADHDTALAALLMNAVMAAGGIIRPFTDDAIDALFRRVADPAADTRLMLTPGGSLAAAGLVTAPPGAGIRAAVVGGVHPDHRGRGLGRALLAWQVERAAALRAAAPADGARWLVQAQAGQADDSAARLYRRFGLDPVRSFLSMRAATAGDRAAPVPAGITVTPYGTGLRDALHAAHEEAFSDHWGHDYSPADDWAARTTGHPLFRPDLSLIGQDGGEIVGYVLAYASGDSVYYGQVGTRRPWRGRGLASALLAASLAAAAADGVRAAALDVDADSPTRAVGVYQRLGFTADPAASVAYERPL